MKFVVHKAVAEKTHTVELTSSEIAALFCLMGCVSGSPEGTVRELLTPMYDAIDKYIGDPQVSSGAVPSCINDDGSAVEQFLDNRDFQHMVRQLNK